MCVHVCVCVLNIWYIYKKTKKQQKNKKTKNKASTLILDNKISSCGTILSPILQQKQKQKPKHNHGTFQTICKKNTAQATS